MKGPDVPGSIHLIPNIRSIPYLPRDADNVNIQGVPAAATRLP